MPQSHTADQLTAPRGRDTADTTKLELSNQLSLPSKMVSKLERKDTKSHITDKDPVRGGSRISGKGFLCIKVWGLALLIFSYFS